MLKEFSTNQFYKYLHGHTNNPISQFHADIKIVLAYSVGLMIMGGTRRKEQNIRNYINVK